MSTKTIKKKDVLIQKLRVYHIPPSFRLGIHSSKKKKIYRKRKHKNKQYE